ncbi:DUF3159 domain-containing protein [Corynebacterium sp. CCM 8835]|nr:DUF3159 domain-containing protein [Corynebacterium antarcticum]MCK7660340.1 DUF3159 domain-containing protein [Corynebacterium antarcticum]MCL0244790.1 DUF3159 domain-containing protein [Corynebacterium antarcticum]MCX7491163.1 DUF3159 domain-containing protein [Corynebacterium antarcticum]MCX7539654.1 DUF3159 domain-containing protein [Corynebacterium antarcticum]
MVDGAGTDEPPAPTLLEQMGGLGGLVSSTLPILVLIPVNNRFGLTWALIASLMVATTIFTWRLARRENLQPAISGLLGVAIGAAFALFTGEAKAYFLYGIWMSLLFAVVFITSVVVRWPMVGVAWRGVNGHDMSWRTIPGARRAYSWATIAWSLVFLARFLVQRNLYDADATSALAIARIAMGWPLTGVAALLTVWAVRHASKAIESASPDPADPVESAPSESA